KDQSLFERYERRKGRSHGTVDRLGHSPFDVVSVEHFRDGRGGRGSRQTDHSLGAYAVGFFAGPQRHGAVIALQVASLWRTAVRRVVHSHHVHSGHEGRIGIHIARQLPVTHAIRGHHKGAESVLGVVAEHGTLEVFDPG